MDAIKVAIYHSLLEVRQESPVGSVLVLTPHVHVNKNFLTEDIHTSDKVIELMGQIRDKVVLRISEGDTGQRLAVEALQRCLSSLDIMPHRLFVSMDLESRGLYYFQ